jgi:hypothetical protein
VANKENIQKWVDALRSGEYKQTKATLHRLVKFHSTPPGYCCLGVACEISGVVETRELSEDGEIEIYDGKAGWLPYSVMRWLGFSSNNPSVKVGGVWHKLAELNDGDADFKEIAGHIERTYL